MMDSTGNPVPEELEAKLREALETLDAIRNGDVDAIVVGGLNGQQVYTLINADRPYRILIEQMQEGALTLSEEGVILYCNDRFAQLAQVDKSEVLGSLIHSFFPNAIHVLAPGTSRELDLVSKSGVAVPVNLSLAEMQVEEDAPAVICGVVTDLTLNRKRSDELASEIEVRRRAEDSLQLTLDAAGMGAWDLDLATGLARCSSRHDEIFGYFRPRGMWRIEDSLAQFLPEERETVRQSFDDARRTGVLEFVRRIRRANDDAIRWLHVKGRTYFDGDNPVRVAGVVSDITDQRAVEEQLRQAQKMEAVGQLTGGLAHDFNNLLTGISGSIEFLQKRVAQGRLHEVDRYIAAAQSGVTRAAALTHRLLAFSRRQTLDPKPVDVNRLVGAMEDLIRRSVGPSIEIQVIAANDLWPTLADPNQLENALLNLCINARDAMPDGGRLSLETANKWLDHQAARELELAPGQYVRLSVTDQGTGMPPEIIKKAFDPFFTTKPLGRGTGLGLSMIYGFARQSGGQVRILSEVGIGTTVKIYLPRIGDTSIPDEDDAKSAGTGAVPSADGETVLLIDDEPAIRMLIGEILEEAGYIVLEAWDGASGLKILQSAEKVDLLITDVGLPGGMNGRQVADAARQVRPRLKVLFITGYADKAAVGGEALGQGMQLLTKPFDMSTLPARVKQMIDGPEEA